MTDSLNPGSPAEIIALWADILRDLSAEGLHYSENEANLLELIEYREPPGE